MRYFSSLLVLFFIIILFAGCSSSSKLPTQPDNPQIPSGDTQADKLSLLYQGAFEIDLETQTITQIENRQSDFIYDITGFLPDKCPGGCFRFAIIGVVGTVLEIELTLENPLAIQVYDARVLYLDLFSKTVLNPDSYTDFLGTPITGIYPFTAFTKEDPNRAFPVGPGEMDTEIMFLDFPPGAPSAVTYAITAHLPGMTPEPYEISEMSQTGELTTAGGNATISCKVDDHQDDISGVYMDATPFTGGPVQLLFADPLWEVEISNTQGAPEGTYNQLIMALSPSPQNISTYNYVEITVSGGASEDPVAIISSPCPTTEIQVDSSLFFDGRLSTDDTPPLIGYAWDFNWDLGPGTFDVESTLDHLNHKFESTGTFTVGLRVEDSDHQYDYVTVNVTVVDAFPRAWSPETLVTGWEGVECTERNYDPSDVIVVDCDGIVHMVFRLRSTGSHSSGLYYVNYDGVTMSEPEYFPGTEDRLMQPTLRLDNQGDLHLLYYTYSRVNQNGYINYCKRTGGVWSSPYVVVDNTDFPGYIIDNPNSTMAVNYRGEIMVALVLEDSSDVWYIAYVTFDGTSWSSPEYATELYVRLSSTSNTRPSPYLVADSEGKFHLIYISWPSPTAASDYDLWHTVYDGSWSTSEKFCDYSGLNIAISGYIASDDDFFAVWQTSQFGTFNAMYARYDAQTSTWDDPIRVSQNPQANDYSFIPDIAVDADGNIMYVWEYYDDAALRHLYYKTFHETDSASTILNAPENEIIAGNWNTANLDLFFEPNGKIHIVWEDQRTDPHNYWYRDLYYTVWE